MRVFSLPKEFEIYNELLKNRIVFLSGNIDEKSAKEIVAKLLYLDSKSHDDIILYINSPGGEINSGFMIYDTMKYIKSDVVTIGIVLCASMASIILMSGTKGKRKMLPHSEVMLHQPLGSTEGQATDIIIASEHMKKIKQTLTDIILMNTKLDQGMVINLERDFWLSSDIALNYGIVDRIIEPIGV
ncbi:MAG: ATP-dependent Clp protease proteolytic subunit [Bacilli bacterium]|nr:ATP-dependent Clp protease proteolytic subunit [Bacilli bacterium]MCI9585047.1 ATP-dependent Clp protease proteolytic subunit [Bacilli bacterium]